MIIKPIIIVNNTNPNPPPTPAPTPIPVPPAPIIPIPIDDDCDILSGNSPRFKQTPYIEDIQRKFYRKVAVAEHIYSRDTFKQGLNVIIIQRDKKYTKSICILI